MKMRARKSILCEKATEFPCVLPLRHLPNSEKKRCQAKINAPGGGGGGGGPPLKKFFYYYYYYYWVIKALLCDIK